MNRFTATAAALALACAPLAAEAATGAQLLNGKAQFIDQNGAPLAGGSVYVYLPGTTTPVSTWQDQGLSIANPFPIALDGRGQAAIWTAPGTYREQVFDALNNLIWDQTTASAGSSVAALSPGATIALSGDVTGTPTTFTGSAPITIPTTLAAATTATQGAVVLTTSAVAQAGTSTSQAVTPAAMASVLQGATMTFVADASPTPNLVTLNPTPAIAAYATGQRLTFQLGNTTSGSVTVSVSGLAAKNLKAGTSNVATGLVAGRWYTIGYDGAAWQLLTPATGCSGSACWEIAPGGLWKQWGNTTVGPTTSASQTLPLACPTNAPVSATATGSINQANAVQVTSISTTSITLNNAGGGSGPVYWAVVCN